MNEESENLGRNIKEINNQDSISKEMNNQKKSSSVLSRVEDNTEKKANDLYQHDEYEIKSQFNDGKSVFIGNLNFKVTEKDLKDFFSKIGVVEYVKIPMKNGKPMGVAFVNFETSQSALEAIKIYNEKDLLGRKAYMRLASDPHPHAPFTGPKKSQKQYPQSKNDQQPHKDYEKYDKNRRDYRDDRPLRATNYRQRPISQYDYDYDYYNYYGDYSEYDDNKRYKSSDYDQRIYRRSDYDQRIPRERYIEKYHRREERYYPPRQIESNTVHGDPIYLRSRMRTIGPYWH